MKETIVTDEIVERAARAMALSEKKDPDAPAYIRYPGAETFGLVWRDKYAAQARAALTAVIDDLVRGEREVCAEIAEDADIEEWQVAAAIRARG